MRFHAKCLCHAFVLFALLPVATAFGADAVRGELILFADNGGWCWYQDERAIVDTQRQTLVIASVANKSGAGGKDKAGDIQATMYDLPTAHHHTAVLHAGLFDRDGGDDHNEPALTILPSGKYIAIYTGHNNDKKSHYRRYDPETGEWGKEQAFDWASMPGGSDFPATYSNVFHLADEQRLYNFARNDDKSPNFMVSKDGGQSWSYGGQLTTSGDVGYVNGYFKYCANGEDRIDFTATEQHPRDFNTSIYHGYIKDGKAHNAKGRVIDEDIFDKKNLAVPEDFTEVFAANTSVDGVKMTRAWNIDLHRYEDGTIVALFKTRANDSEQDHRYFYARYDGKKWDYTQLGKAGGKLYDREQDYTGLAAVDPNNPAVVYISTPIDPESGEKHPHHEIFRGETDDEGESWQWKAITQNSTMDNLRPIVPKWDKQHTAVLWLRGTYRSMSDYDLSVVGIIRQDQP